MDTGQFPIALTTSLGDGAVMLRSMKGSEGLSELFQYELDVEADEVVRVGDLLGSSVTVRLNQEGGDPRYFNGIVSSAQLTDCDGDKFVHQLTVRPWLWALTLNSNCRIFQEKTIPEIIKEVLRASGGGEFEVRLTGDYAVQEYVVQYAESDFNFFCRLLERAGIYFFFKHSQAGHAVVLADSLSAHSKAKTCSTLPYYPPDRNHAYMDQYVWLWRAAKCITPGAAASTDFNFKRPRALMLSRVSEPTRAPLADAEVFEYPGGFADSSEGRECVRLRLEQLRVCHDVVVGQTNARGLATGDLFRLTDHPLREQNREFLVTGAQYQIRAPLLASTSAASRDPVYECTFQALNSSQPFRPPARSVRPRVHGPQTAIVVGRAGQEICTDEHGRIKVQFHWDRYGRSDEHSSCWIRVAHPWAGVQWGAVHIPRIGQEVVVDFLEGDPDRPIVVGSVYNGENRPPYDLPANQTQSGIKSRSSKGGWVQNANEIRFEDAKGSEELYIQAEKDNNNLIKNDRKTEIGNNDTLEIKVDRSKKIGSNETIEVGVDRKDTVGANETISIGANRDEEIGANLTQNVTGNVSETVGGSAEQTVTGNVTQTVMGSSTRTVMGSVTQTVMGAQSQTITGSLTQTAVGGVTIATPAAVTISAAGGFNVVAPGGTNTVDNKFWKTGGASGDLFGYKLAVLGAKTDIIAGLTLLLANNKVDIVAMKVDVARTKFANNPTTIESAGMAILQGHVNLHFFGLVVIA